MPGPCQVRGGRDLRGGALAFDHEENCVEMHLIMISIQTGGGGGEREIQKVLTENEMYTSFPATWNFESNF